MENWWWWWWEKIWSPKIAFQKEVAKLQANETLKVKQKLEHDILDEWYGHHPN